MLFYCYVINNLLTVEPVAGSVPAKAVPNRQKRGVAGTGSRHDVVVRGGAAAFVKLLWFQGVLGSSGTEILDVRGTPGYRITHRPAEEFLD